VWLGTAEEKNVHLTMLTRIEPKDLPHVNVGDGEARKVRYFPGRLPIGIHMAGRGVLVYVVIDPWLDEFGVFLERHVALLPSPTRLDASDRRAAAHPGTSPSV
jgi:hypothetical protein